MPPCLIFFYRYGVFMALRENLLKKMELDQQALQVIRSFQPTSGLVKIDKQAMDRLFEQAGYVRERHRDLDLYFQKVQTGAPAYYIVLDNDLSVYATTLEDVVMRKSPYVKEMISIRNIIKILNDGDVIRSKKADTVKQIHAECVSALDLHIEPSDLEAIKMDGFCALETGNAKEVSICLSLFAELLRYYPAPAFLAQPDYLIIGEKRTGPAGVNIYGPHVVYNQTFNQLKLIKAHIKKEETGKIELFHETVQGSAKSDMDGMDVISFLHGCAQSITSIETKLTP